MIQTLVSSKYQVVIPKEVRKEAGIKPGQKLNVYTANGQIMLTTDRKWPDDYIKELKGLWKSSEIDAFIEEERSSWE